MSPTGGDVAGTASGGLTEQLVALRGELWQRHAQLQGMNPEDARYEDASAEVIELTDTLLRVESQVAANSRPLRRWLPRLGFVVVGLLVIGAVAITLATPTGNPLLPRVAAGVALLTVLAALGAVLLARRRGRASEPSRD